MDLADDIAYSTYDLEDSFKAGFLSPLEIVASSDELLDRVATKVGEKLNRKFNKREILEILLEIFSDAIIPENEYAPIDVSNPTGAVLLATNALTNSAEYARNGRLRTNLTSDLISIFISGVKFEPNVDNPALSIAKFDDETLLKVEVLKNYTYEATIMSPRLKVAEHRGYEIVHTLFEGLNNEKGEYLLPSDFRQLHQLLSDEADKCRLISDFIAGMTDRYALEFYSRLQGENPQSIFKPF